MRRTTQLTISGVVLIAISVYIIYIGGFSFGSLSVAVTLLWIASFLILIARATRRVSDKLSPKA